MTNTKETAEQTPTDDAFRSLLESQRRCFDLQMSLWRMMMAPSALVPQKPAPSNAEQQRENGLRLLDAHADAILSSLSEASRRQPEPAVPGFEPALTDARLAEWVA